MVVSAISLVIGVVFGAAASWLISRHYYRRALTDAHDAFIAQRLDHCSEGDKTFLVALLQHDQPIPRYALINVEFEIADGRNDEWGSNTSTMIHSVKDRAPHSLQFLGGSDIAEDRQTVSLTERGRENAEYLVRKEYRKACFRVIDDNENQRMSMFKREHGREPRKRAGGGSGVVIRHNIGT